MFRQARRDAGRPEQVGLPLSREIFCAPTRAEATERARPFLQRKYETYSAWGQDRVMPANESFDLPFEQLADDRFVIGTPDDCIRLLLPWRQFGVDHFVLRTCWSGMPVADALRSIDLLTREVLPGPPLRLELRFAHRLGGQITCPQHGTFDS